MMWTYWFLWPWIVLLLMGFFRPLRLTWVIAPIWLFSFVGWSFWRIVLVAILVVFWVLRYKLADPLNWSETELGFVFFALMIVVSVVSGMALSSHEQATRSQTHSAPTPPPVNMYFSYVKEDGHRVPVERADIKYIDKDLLPSLLCSDTALKVTLGGVVIGPEQLNVLTDDQLTSMVCT